MALPIIDSVEYGQFKWMNGKCIRIRSLCVDGRDETADFLFSLKPDVLSDKKLCDQFLGYVSSIADEYQAVSVDVFRRLTTATANHWPNQWEIRIQQWKTNHRFYGFMCGGEFLIVLYRDKQDRQPDPKDLRFVKAVREYWIKHHPGAS